MSYAIIRNAKYKRENLKGIYRHNERKNKNYSNKNINEELSYLNYSLKDCTHSYEKEFDLVKEKYNLKGQIKTVSNIACEYIITSDKEFFDNIGEEETRRFQTRESIGTCPVCGSLVYESKTNFYCSNHDCHFALWKDNRYLQSMEKNMDKKMAAELLKNGSVHVKDLYSRKKNMYFEADLHMDADETGRVNFSLSFPQKKSKNKSKKK